MRSLRLTAVILLVLASTLVFTSTALADSVTMTLVSVGGNNAGGVYTYPYNFSINGKGSVALICDSYDNHVSIGESWQANVSGLLSGNGLFGNELLDYKTAGLIFKSIFNGTLGANVGNFAIWGLFSTNAQNNPFFQSSGALTIEQQYLSLASTAPNSAFSGLSLYTPFSCDRSRNGLPQEYIGYSPVPEPTSLALFGTGLLSLAGVVRKKPKSAN